MDGYSALKLRFIRNVGFKGFADFISRVATFFVTVFLARKLEKSQFGIFSYALTLAMTWGLVLDFGWNNVLIRQGKKDDFKTTFSSTFLIKITVMVLIAVLIYFCPLLPASVPYPLFIFAFMYASAFSFQDTQSAALAGQEKFAIEWIFKLIPRWVPVLLLFFLVRGPGTPLSAALILGVSSFSVTLLMTIPLYSALQGRVFIDWSTIRLILREGFPFGLAILVWGIYTRMDVILLGIYGFSFDQIGTYAAAIKIVEFGRGVGIIFYMAMIPILTDMEHDPRKLWGVVLKVGLLFFVGALIILPILPFLSKLIMGRVFGQAYLESAAPFGVAMMGILLFFINTPFQAAMIALGKGKLTLLGSGLMLLTSFTVNLVLLPSGRLTAPAWGIVAAEGVWLCFNIMFLRSRLLAHPAPSL